MTDFNTTDNLTAEAERALSRFIDREFTAINQDLITRAIGEDYDAIELLTPRALYCEECGHECEESEDTQGSEDCPECGESDGGMLVADPEQGWPPMWSTVWKCSDWAMRKIVNDPTIASEAGFEAYDLEDGVYLGVQGAGYGFMAAHWAPLYRGLFADSPVKYGDKLPGDEIVCDRCQGTGCAECDNEGRWPFESWEMKSERQSEAARKLLSRLVEADSAAWRRDDTIVDLMEEAKRILAMVE
jgi:hypothetical protein